MADFIGGMEIERGASLSGDSVYRYTLHRRWDHEREPLYFVMLNPSTADAESDDNTIRKCMGLAWRLGYGGISVYNLFAFRATDPRDLKRAMREGMDVIGPRNYHTIREVLASGCVTVAAWGAHAPQWRVDEVLAMPGADRLFTLGLTLKGVPRHPLMLGYAGLALSPYRSER